jgi:hypothetical protein
MTFALFNHVFFDYLPPGFVVMRVQMRQSKSILNSRLQKRLSYAHAVINIVRTAGPFVSVGAYPFFGFVTAAAD